MTNAETLTTGLLDFQHRVGIKIWTFTGSGNSGDPDYSYTAGVDATAATRIPAQGNTDSPPWFNGHWIVQAAGTYYDPSYGSDAVPNAGTSSAKSAYENIAFDGYFNYELIPVGNDYTLGDRIKVYK